MAMSRKFIVLISIFVISSKFVHAADFIRNKVQLMEEKIFNSVKISDTLKRMILPIGVKATSPNIMIEFIGGIAKALRKYEKSDVATRATATRTERLTTLVNILQEHTTKSQSEVLSYLNSVSVEYTNLWASKEVYVKDLSPDKIVELEKFENVIIIR